jgi:hypothetical protein
MKAGRRYLGDGFVRPPMQAMTVASVFLRRRKTSVDVETPAGRVRNQSLRRRRRDRHEPNIAAKGHELSKKLSRVLSLVGTIGHCGHGSSGQRPLQWRHVDSLASALLAGAQAGLKGNASYREAKARGGQAANVKPAAEVSRIAATGWPEVWGETYP